MDQAWKLKNEAIKVSWKISHKIKDGCIQLWKIQASKNTINNSKDNKYL